MGFFEGLGKAVGKMVAQTQQLQQQADIYREDYEFMSNRELVEEGKKWQSHSGSEARARNIAIRTILKERGVM